MKSTESARLTPLPPSEWDEEVLDALGAFPSSRDFVLKQWRDKTGDGRGSYTLGLFAHYPELAKAFMTLNKHVAVDSKLTLREKEIIILRTSWLYKSEYEYVQHLILGARAGLTETDFQYIQQGGRAKDWNEKDALLVQMVDDLHRHARIAPATWQDLETHYNHQQVLDMICLVGYYETLAKAVSSFDIPLEPGVTPIDDATRQRLLSDK